MEKKLDLRVQKTYQNLFAALQELLCEKSLGDITVTELCDRAMTRKATFYKHFGDKYELFAFMIQEIQKEYNESYTEGNAVLKDDTYYTGIFLYFLNFLEQHRQMVLRVLQDPSRATAFALLSDHIQRDLTQHFSEDMKNGKQTASSPELLAAMYTGVIVYSSIWWITHENEISKETVVKQYETLVQCFSNSFNSTHD